MRQAELLLLAGPSWSVVICFLQVSGAVPVRIPTERTTGTVLTTPHFSNVRIVADTSS